MDHNVVRISVSSWIVASVNSGEETKVLTEYTLWFQDARDFCQGLHEIGNMLKDREQGDITDLIGGKLHIVCVHSSLVNVVCTAQ
jgi:hypothetical protein